MGGEWKEIRLSDFADLCLGKMLDAEKNRGEFLPYLGNKNVRWGEFDLNDLQEMRFMPNELERYGLVLGDLIICEGGEPGRCAIWKDQVPNMKIQKALHRVRPRNGLNAEYLHYWFMLAGKLGWLEPYFTGTTIKHLTGKALANLKIRIPSIETQRAIAQLLGSLDDKIELNRKQNATLEEMAQALFQSWFVDFDPVIDKALAAGNEIPEPLQAKARRRAALGDRRKALPAEVAALFPDSFVETEEMGFVPAGWGIVPFKEVYDIFDSKRVPLEKQERAAIPGPYPYYGATSKMDSIDKFIFEGIHILVGEDGSVIDEKGFPFTQYVWGQFWVNNHAHVLKGKGSVSDETLLVFLKQTNVSAFVTGAVQPKINQMNLGRISFTRGTDNVHAAFSSKISSLFEKIRSNSEEVETLITLRDTLLPKLISGELRLGEVSEMANNTEQKSKSQYPMKGNLS
jgi:type I restriction enzyme S subunit